MTQPCIPGRLKHHWLYQVQLGASPRKKVCRYCKTEVRFLRRAGAFKKTFGSD
jgi:hypothetical protein